MVHGGVRDVLVTNEIVGRQKLRRLMALAHHARGSASAPTTRRRSPRSTRPPARPGSRCRSMSRSTWAATAAASSRASRRSRLARADRATRRISRFAGLQAYHGSAQHLRGWEERQTGDRQARPTRRRRPATCWRANGIACANITGAGTGTFEFEAASGVYTELQCGSYIFMDADYGRNLDRDGAPTKRLRAEPLRLGDGDEPPDRGPRDRRRRPEGARLRLRARRPSGTSPPPPTSAPPTSTAASAITGATNRLQHRRQDPPRPRPLRPDRQPLRLVCRHPRRPRRSSSGRSPPAARCIDQSSWRELEPVDVSYHLILGLEKGA